jgi:hypothetical protein
MVSDPDGSDKSEKFSKVSEVEMKSVNLQIDLYKQLRIQLIEVVRRYKKEGKVDLANLISESLKES